MMHRNLKKGSGDESPQLQMDRREFAREFVASAIAGPVVLRLDESESTAQQEPEPLRMEDQLVALLRDQFGDRLEEDQWSQVRSKVRSQLTAAQSLREFKLLNSDEPATVFSAQRRT